jgi:hypothetical protein
MFPVGRHCWLVFSSTPVLRVFLYYIRRLRLPIPCHNAITWFWNKSFTVRRPDFSGVISSLAAISLIVIQCASSTVVHCLLWCPFWSLFSLSVMLLTCPTPLARYIFSAIFHIYFCKNRHFLSRSDTLLPHHLLLFSGISAPANF